MSSDNEIIERIELYTRGKMSHEERISFEKELASDEQLQKSLDLSMLADELVIAQEALKLKEQMRKDLYKSKPDWNIYALALLIALGGIIYGYYNFNSKDSVSVVRVSSEHDRAVNNEKSNKPEEVPLLKTHKGAEQIINHSGDRPIVSQDLIVPESYPGNEPQVLQQPLIIASDSADSKEQKKINASISPPEDPCANFKGDVKFAVSASCKGQETGNVQVYPETVKGGKPPYTFMLNERQSLSYFDHLSSGIYNLKIIDARNCIAENAFKVIVEEKICSVSKSYIFNPEYDRAWSVPYDRDKDPVNLVLIEKSGKVYYQSRVQSYQPAEWSGESNMGLNSGVGLYFFTIEYSDGSIDEGTITVTR